MNIIQAIEDRRFFLPIFKDLSTWRSWQVYLKALFGLPIGNKDDRRLFRACTGLYSPPKTKKRESFVICGRRSGKSFMSAVIALYLATFRDWSKSLSAGERGHIFIIANDKAQARIIKNYISGIIENVPSFKKLVSKDLTFDIELKNGVNISVKTCNFRTLRGYTILAVILEELAFWRDRETSANPANEILTALRPALATVDDSLLLGISTPHGKNGVLYENFRSHFGEKKKEAPLIWRAETKTMNPTIDHNLIDKALKDDPNSARAEWLAEWREDLEAFLPPELIESVVVPNRFELPKVRDVSYHAFTDASGGRRDSFALAIAHREENGKIVLDVLRERKPPFKPEEVVEEYSALLKQYDVREVQGDKYAGEWVSESFQKQGIMLDQSARPASEIYLEFLPLISNAQVELLDNKVLFSQVRGLERITRRGGKDLITHYPGGHDDVAVSVAGAVVRAHKQETNFPLYPSYGYVEKVETLEQQLDRESRIWLLDKPKEKKKSTDIIGKYVNPDGSLSEDDDDELFY